MKEKASSLTILLFKATLVTASILSLLVIISAASIVGFGYFQLNAFSNAAEISKPALSNLVKEGLSEKIIATNNKKNLLILGVDEVQNRQGAPLLTDTIILMSMDTTTLETNVVSLPRDLWNDEYQTKVNSLYHYGSSRYPDHPELFATEVIMSMTGVPIHHTLVLTLDKVALVIDALGGIEINVENGFTDAQFPRDDVDIRTETDPDVLYETVTFEQGMQTMDGKTALKYIRSRHSLGDQGTDTARSERQQQVISAIVDKAFARETVTDANKLGALFKTYQETFGKDLPMTQLLAVAKQVATYDFDLTIAINTNSISIQTEEENGVITHPPISETQDQWAYVILDKVAFKKEIWQKLDLINN